MLYLLSYAGSGGGAGRNRTDVQGFAGLCIATLPPRHRLAISFPPAVEKPARRPSGGGELRLCVHAGQAAWHCVVQRATLYSANAGVIAGKGVRDGLFGRPPKHGEFPDPAQSGQ